MVQKPFLIKHTQSRRVRKGSGKGNGKVEIDLPRTRNPGKSRKVPGTFPGRVHVDCKFRFYPFWDEQDTSYRNQPIETCVLIVFLRCVFGPVSGPIKNPQSRKVREGSGKVSAKLIILRRARNKNK